MYECTLLGDRLVLPTVGANAITLMPAAARRRGRKSCRPRDEIRDTRSGFVHTDSLPHCVVFEGDRFLCLPGTVMS
jgi:hypothetical protein